MLHSDYEGSRLEFLKILVEQGEEPAFLRRSRRVSEALEQLHDQLQDQRHRLLKGPRSSLSVLALRVQQDWSKLGAYLANRDEVQIYEGLFNDWQPDSGELTRAKISWLWSIRRLLVKFHSSVDRFNATWRRILDRVDLESINRMLREYNIYYPMEKTCAFGNEDIERLGFIATRPMTRDELQDAYPFIVVPQLRNK